MKSVRTRLECRSGLYLAVNDAGVVQVGISEMVGITLNDCLGIERKRLTICHLAFDPSWTSCCCITEWSYFTLHWHEFWGSNLYFGKICNYHFYINCNRNSICTDRLKNCEFSIGYSLVEGVWYNITVRSCHTLSFHLWMILTIYFTPEESVCKIYLGSLGVINMVHGGSYHVKLWKLIWD